MVKRKFLFAGLLLALVIASGCVQYSPQPSTGGSTTAGTGAGPAAATEVTVEIKGFAFKPATLTIAKDTTVTWVNLDSAPHTATAAATFDSGTLQQGESRSKTFNSVGSFDYICTIHPYMKGKIVVE